MREKLIDLLMDLPITRLTYEEMEKYSGDVADYLIANGVTIQKWIPVSERLPEHGQIVLCYLRFDDMRILQWDNQFYWWLGYGKGDDWQKADVTHWMPLPEPPKEG